MAPPFGSASIVTATARSLSSEIARAIRARMRELGFSQRDLARRVGVHVAYINRAARGKPNLTIRELGNIADALHMRISMRLEGRQ